MSTRLFRKIISIIATAFYVFSITSSGIITRNVSANYGNNSPAYNPRSYHDGNYFPQTKQCKPSDTGCGIYDTKLLNTNLQVRQIASSSALPGILLVSFIGSNEVRYSRTGGISWAPMDTSPWAGFSTDPVQVAITPKTDALSSTRFIIAPTLTLRVWPYPDSGGSWPYPESIFRSGDWGKTWAGMQVATPNSNEWTGPLNAVQLISSIPDPRVIYYLSSWVESSPIGAWTEVWQAYASVDGGISWEGMYTYWEGFPHRIIPSLIKPQRIYVSFGYSSSWKVSDDAGQTWSKTLDIPDDNFVFDPVYEDILYSGFRYSSNGGTTWENYQTIPCEGDVIADPKVSGIIYKVCDGNMWRSKDKGDHWVRLNPANVQLLTADFGKPGRLLVAKSDGLWASVNNGDTWNNLTLSYGSSPNNIYLPSLKK